MAWRGQLSKSLKELRILLCQSSPSSSSARAFVEQNYKDLKTLNPKLPILIRECNGIEPQLWARYECWDAIEVELLQNALPKASNQQVGAGSQAFMLFSRSR